MIEFYHIRDISLLILSAAYLCLGECDCISFPGVVAVKFWVLINEAWTSQGILKARQHWYGQILYLPRLYDHTTSFELKWDLSCALSYDVWVFGHPSRDIEIVLSNQLAVVGLNFYITKWAHPYHFCVLVNDEGYLLCFERIARGKRGCIWRDLLNTREELRCELNASTNLIAHFEAMIGYRLYIVKNRTRSNEIFLFSQVCRWGQDPAWIVDIDNEFFSIENLGVVRVIDHKTQIVYSNLFHSICLDPHFSKSGIICLREYF